MKFLSVKSGIILIGSLIFLISCSSGGKWVKPGSGESELDDDYQDCRSMALQKCGNEVWPGYVVAKSCVNDYMKDCLTQRGWEYRKQ